MSLAIEIGRMRVGQLVLASALFSLSYPSRAAAGREPSAGPEGRRPAHTEDVGRVEAPPSRPPSPSARARRGAFMAVGPGVAAATGPTASVLTPGVGLSGRVGYTLWPFLTLAVQATIVAGRYDDGVLRREFFQQYFYTGTVDFTVPLRRFALGLHAGAGAEQVSNNLLQVAGFRRSAQKFAFVYEGGLHLELQSQNPHLAGGLRASYFGAPAFSHAGTVLSTLYLSYAF